MFPVLRVQPCEYYIAAGGLREQLFIVLPVLGKESMSNEKFRFDLKPDPD